jgi:tetratricopeptide (TPR) repeat protein
VEIEMKSRTLWVVLTVLLTGFLPGPVSAGSSPLAEARALFADRHYDKAISLIKKEIKTNGERADLLVLMADSFLALGEEGQAEKTYRRALDLEPRHPDGNLNLGMLLVTKREREEAIALIKRVLAENPDHARAHFCLGLAYNARADINDAFAQYKILKKLDKALASELYNAIFLK